MSAPKLFRKGLLFATAAALCFAGVAGVRTLFAAQGSNQDEEVQIDQEVFNELKAKGEIIESSPLYVQLNPIANAITRAAQPRYNHPFKFYLVHEPQPNAFATPGGNVYVTDALLYFVSAASYATVGYGDVVLPWKWRTLGPVESIIGVLMCELSASFLFAIVSRLVDREARVSDTPDRDAGDTISGTRIRQKRVSRTQGSIKSRSPVTEGWERAT